jgi:hypothetical protein
LLACEDTLLFKPFPNYDLSQSLNPLKIGDKNYICFNQTKVASTPYWFYNMSQNSGLNKLALSFCFVGLRRYCTVKAFSE